MLNRQGCHNSGVAITVAPELKRYVRNSKTIKTNNGDEQTRTLRETLHDGQMVLQDRGFSGS